jgi:undecaprenyl-diphosphatase
VDDLIKTILLGVLEGITEFLPVSSTGHLFLAQPLLGADPKDEFWKAFGIVIQIGAIFAVIIYFRRRILDLVIGTKRPSYFAKTMPRYEIDQAAWALTGSAIAGKTVSGPGVEPMTAEDVEKADSYLTKHQRYHAIAMIMVATVPVLAAGLAVKIVSEKLEESPVAIAAALGIGGVLMWIIEKLPIKVTSKKMENITLRQALIIGFCQILAATFPGTSRSASTIMSGIAAGVSREAATEFSFFLAIPAMFAACGYKLLKWMKDNHPDGKQLMLMGVGTFVSFLVAWVVIAGFMNYIRKHTFVGFAIYRILFALFVLGFWWHSTHG